MPSGQASVLATHVRRLAASRGHAGLDDADLLGRFIRHADEAAFAALVNRHGGMVLGVCRRLLGHVQDAEDACQATFLVLARKARSIRHTGGVAGWLHSVAFRVANRLRQTRDTRRAREQPLPELPSTGADLSWYEVRAAIDEEINRLPGRYRAPVVLCYLQGRTRDEAARHLGWSAGTLRGRLNRARQLLRTRLTRRGIGLPAALAATLVSGTSSAALPAGVAALVVRAAAAGPGRALAAGWVSKQTSILYNGALHTMFVARLKLVTACLLALVIAGSVGTIVVRSSDDGALPAGAKRNAETSPVVPPTTASDWSSVRKVSETQVGDDVLALDVSPDGKSVVVGTSDGWLRLLDIPSGKVSSGEQLGFAIRAARFAPDGRSVAVGGDQSTVSFWRVIGPKTTATLDLGQGSVRGITFSPDGRIVATGGNDHAIRIWDVASGKATRRLSAPRLTGSVAFSADGTRLATTEDTGGVRVWDAATGRVVFESAKADVPGRPLATAVAFSPDGKTMASSGNGGMIRLWDATSGKLVLEAFGHRQPVSALAFSPDGRLLASGSGDETVHIWNLGTGGQEFVIKGHHHQGVRAAAFTPDGMYLVTAAGDGKVRIWARSAPTQPDAVNRKTGRPVGNVFAPLVEELAESGRSEVEAVNALYLAALGRFPTELELKYLFNVRIQGSEDRKIRLQAVLSTLVETKEFRDHVDALHRMK